MIISKVICEDITDYCNSVIYKDNVIRAQFLLTKNNIIANNKGKIEAKDLLTRVNFIVKEYIANYSNLSNKYNKDDFLAKICSYKHTNEDDPGLIKAEELIHEIEKYKVFVKEKINNSLLIDNKGRVYGIETKCKILKKIISSKEESNVKNIIKKIDSEDCLEKYKLTDTEDPNDSGKLKEISDDLLKIFDNQKNLINTYTQNIVQFVDSSLNKKMNNLIKSPSTYEKLLNNIGSIKISIGGILSIDIDKISNNYKDHNSENINIDDSDDIADIDDIADMTNTSIQIQETAISIINLETENN